MVFSREAQANLAKVRETDSTWEFHIPRIDTWGYLARYLGVSSNGDGDGNDVVDGDDDKTGGRQRGQG